MAAFSISGHQVELVQPPSMMEKQAKTKSEKKAKVAESPAPEESPVQPAKSIEGMFLLIKVTL